MRSSYEEWMKVIFRSLFFRVDYSLSLESFCWENMKRKNDRGFHMDLSALQSTRYTSLDLIFSHTKIRYAKLNALSTSNQTKYSMIEKNRRLGTDGKIPKCVLLSIPITNGMNGNPYKFLCRRQLEEHKEDGLSPCGRTLKARVQSSCERTKNQRNCSAQNEEIA